MEVRFSATDRSPNARIREGGEEFQQDRFADVRTNPEVIGMRDGAGPFGHVG
jgi:hypothetical protein